MTIQKPQIPFHMEMTFTHGIAREIWPGVRRIVAGNAGPMTHNGTNTYLLGKGNVALIDPGPDDSTHVEAILSAIKGEQLTHIFLTHTHKDHSGAIKELKQKTGAPVYAHAAISENRGARRLSETPPDEGFVDTAFAPDHILHDGDEIKGESWGLRAIHTPGHAPDHFCFAHLTEPLLFSGDHVMAWNTSVIIPPEGNMAAYLSSLKKLVGGNYERFLPGHGGQARTPERLVKAFLMHRKWRETAIHDHIKSGLSTIDELVPLMYPNVKPEVLPAAALSILAHTEHLCEQGLIETETKPALNSKFKIVKS